MKYKENDLFKRRKEPHYPSGSNNGYSDLLKKVAEKIEAQYNYIKRIQKGLKDNPQLPQSEKDRVKKILDKKISELW